MKTIKPNDNSTGNNWEKLTAYQHARLRTEMYLGSRDVSTASYVGYDGDKIVLREASLAMALLVCFRELWDNALDEMVSHNSGSNLTLEFDEKTCRMRVADDGRGMPIDWREEYQQHAATTLISSTMAGRNFSDERGASRGLNGVGASVVNYVAERFTLQIVRDKQTFDQAFSEGDTELQIEDPIIFPAARGLKTGTAVTFIPSKKVFPTRALPLKFVQDRVMEIALAFPQITVRLNGQKITPPKLQNLFPNSPMIEIDQPGFKAKFWIALDGPTGEMDHGLVNGIPTLNGGTHFDAFKRNFASGLSTALEKDAKKRGVKVTRIDIMKNALIYAICEMDAPTFTSQSKTQLASESATKAVNAALSDPTVFRNIIKKYPEFVETVFLRAEERMGKSDAKLISSAAKAQKNIRVAKLQDATSISRSKCTLFLTEGDSAVAGLGAVRNPEIHGGLPLMGKILNVHPSKVKIRDVLANAALTQIMNSIGLIPGQRAVRPKLRYGRVYITVDSDEDGFNIASLLVNFFFTLWPELFDPLFPPYVYIFETPLIIASKGKTKKYWYTDEYHKFDGDAYKGWDITRAKGLAALKEPDWEYVITNPRVIPLIDDGNLKETMNLLFDENRSDSRKEWMGI
jgi:DNA gyrase/topoisomerase IV subunit B